MNAQIAMILIQILSGMICPRVEEFKQLASQTDNSIDDTLVKVLELVCLFGKTK